MTLLFVLGPSVVYPSERREGVRKKTDRLTPRALAYFSGEFDYPNALDQNAAAHRPCRTTVHWGPCHPPQDPPCRESCAWVHFFFMEAHPFYPAGAMKHARNKRIKATKQSATNGLADGASCQTLGAKGGPGGF